MPSTSSSVPHGGVSHRGDDLRNGVSKQDPRQRLIVALDVSTAAAAQKIVAAVGDSALTYKVGMQLYTAEGPQVVRDLVASGRRVFLDLKYHDIPNTVGAAVSEAAQARREHADRTRVAAAAKCCARQWKRRRCGQN